MRDGSSENINCQQMTKLRRTRIKQHKIGIQGASKIS